MNCALEVVDLFVHSGVKSHDDMESNFMRSRVTFWIRPEMNRRNCWPRLVTLFTKEKLVSIRKVIFHGKIRISIINLLKLQKMHKDKNILWKCWYRNPVLIKMPRKTLLNK